MEQIYKYAGTSFSILMKTSYWGRTQKLLKALARTN